MAVTSSSHLPRSLAKRLIQKKSTVIRWLDYFFNIWPFTTMQICAQLHPKFCLCLFIFQIGTLKMAKDLNFTYLHWRYWWTYIEGIDGPTLKVLMDLHWRYGRTCVEGIDSIFGPTLGVWMDLHWRYIPTLEVWMAVAFAKVAKRFDPIFGKTKRAIECRVKRILSNRSNKKKENLLH